jgi:hypothetical protein
MQGSAYLRRKRRGGPRRKGRRGPEDNASLLSLTALVITRLSAKRPVSGVDPNPSGFYFPRHPLYIADSVRPLVIPQAERRASRGLEKPIATGSGMRDDFNTNMAHCKSSFKK